MTNQELAAEEIYRILGGLTEKEMTALQAQFKLILLMNPEDLLTSLLDDTDLSRELLPVKLLLFGIRANLSPEQMETLDESNVLNVTAIVMLILNGAMFEVLYRREKAKNDLLSDPWKVEKEENGTLYNKAG